MSEQKLWNLVEKKVPGLPYIIVIFAMIEFFILLICLVTSGNQDMVRVYSPEKTIIYEDFYNMNALTEFKTVSGIKNFKDEGYVVSHLVIDKKFPTRTWIALSISIPLIIILFIVFIVRVFEDVFHTQKKKSIKTKNPEQAIDFEETRFEKLFITLGRLNIYALGATIILGAFLFWMVPDLLVFMGKISFQTVSELKWIILCLIIFGGIYLIIRTVLSYKTKAQMIHQQFEIQKNRDRLSIETQLDTKRLENKPEEN